MSTNRLGGGRSARPVAAVSVAAIRPLVSAGSMTSSISKRAAALSAFAFYLVIRFLRWLLGELAPIVRVLIVVAIIGGLVVMTWGELQSLGGEKLFVLSVLTFIVWAVLCLPGTSHART